MPVPARIPRCLLMNPTYCDVAFTFPNISVPIFAFKPVLVQQSTHFADGEIVESLSSTTADFCWSQSSNRALQRAPRTGPFLTHSESFTSKTPSSVITKSSPNSSRRRTTSRLRLRHLRATSCRSRTNRHVMPRRRAHLPTPRHPQLPRRLPTLLPRRRRQPSTSQTRQSMRQDGLQR